MCAARDKADSRPVPVDGAAMPRDVARRHAQADQSSARTALLDFRQRIAPDEVAFVELHSPTETGLVRVDGLVHVVAPQSQRGLEPGGIARAQPGGQHALAASVLEERIPHVTDILRRDEQLEAVLAGVAGACEDRKSTRLNSSHSQISDAVFCLKKKKK